MCWFSLELGKKLDHFLFDRVPNLRLSVLNRVRVSLSPLNPPTRIPVGIDLQTNQRDYKMHAAKMTIISPRGGVMLWDKVPWSDFFQQNIFL